MRTLKRNKTTLWYQLYKGNTPIYETDLNGNVIFDPVTGDPLLTGDYESGYENPVMFYANVSPARSEASTDPFGVNVEYDKTICTCDLSLPIDELSMLYVDKEPEFDASGNVANKPDYKVVKVARSLNSLLIAIKKVTEGMND